MKRVIQTKRMIALAFIALLTLAPTAAVAATQDNAPHIDPTNAIMDYVIEATVGATAIFYIIVYDRSRKRKNRILHKHIDIESQLQTELVETRQQLSTIRQQPKPRTARKKNDHNLLQRLKQLMETERLYTDPALTRKDLAKRLYTNENYLVAAIHDGYNGRTFTEYLNFLRLEYARYMLVHQTELTIKAISEHAGFASYKSFHKLFHNEFGVSPSEFRKIPLHSPPLEGQGWSKGQGWFRHVETDDCPSSR